MKDKTRRRCPLLWPVSNVVLDIDAKAVRHVRETTCKRNCLLLRDCSYQKSQDNQLKLEIKQRKEHLIKDWYPTYTKNS